MIVTTAQGEVEGFERDGIWNFRGLPYAAPPVGERRFRAPQPPEPWAGVRDARHFGPVSWQNKGGLMAMLGDAELDMSEDCLVLNVQTPACDDARRPVMVWVHGGGFVTGSSAVPWYDGTHLATHGDVVVVSVNYRLGALGFLWLGALGEEFRSSGTNGILDQAAALAWVHDNVAAFGGDPDNVTVFGESAGAMSVSTLLALPAARGLVHKAIAQSGAAHNTFTTHVADEVTGTVLAELGATDLTAVLEATPQELVAVEAAVTRRVFRDPARLAGRSGIALAMPFQPVVDGQWLPTDPLTAIRQGAAADVALLAGTNLDEWNLFRVMSPGGIDHPKLLERLDRIAGNGHEFHDTYAASRPEATPDDLWSAVLTDAGFRVPTVRLLEAHHGAAAPGVAAYEYLFTWPTAAFGGVMGSCHALEIPFVFDNLHRGGAELFLGGSVGPELHTLAARMRDAWTAFAHTGVPAAEGLPAWPAFDPRRREVLRLDLQPEVLADPGRAELDRWADLL
ncbi:carboxylesterase/lipase family protein [Rhabdothermincola salaria]|uniref:carboxylesterase/lipase family protein n=1 Tax=Rhabdothermincola salaria TaxID=2903142 RepID=UPI001E2D62E1|nr:carboxylesterase family protein [Rhabdothermincola salaria]MCD9623856.1 carboxylesterase family protein [Rhabdothermincola salaria]